MFLRTLNQRNKTIKRMGYVHAVEEKDLKEAYTGSIQKYNSFQNVVQTVNKVSDVSRI